MTRSDRLFALGCLAVSVLVPGLIWLGRPFDEARATFGLLAGWGLALGVIAPSYVLLSRALREEDSHRFLRAFLRGTGLRFVVSIVAVALFATLVEEPPLKTFLLAFFLGYVLLMALELKLAVGRAPTGRHA